MKLTLALMLLGSSALVAHNSNAAQALAVADRGYVMETGEIVMSGPAGELLEDARVRAAYLGDTA